MRDTPYGNYSDFNNEVDFDDIFRDSDKAYVKRTIEETVSDLFNECFGDRDDKDELYDEFRDYVVDCI
ncbi:MAG: hypothetical protein Q4A15_11690 [Prevotellaceae bacterium]|nr:hypothetical protein [Prevotellaceae bacterium]